MSPVRFPSSLYASAFSALWVPFLLISMAWLLPPHPKTETRTCSPGFVPLVIVSKDGFIQINENIKHTFPSHFDQLAEKAPHWVKKCVTLRQEARATIVAEPSTPFEMIQPIWDLLKEAGFSKVTFISQTSQNQL